MVTKNLSVSQEELEKRGSERNNTDYRKMMISIVIVVLGIVSKGLAESLEKLKNRGRIRNYTDDMMMRMISI